MRAITLLLASAMTLPAADAFAWGAEGHSIVAEIAQRRLTPEAAAKVAEILGPGVSLASGANWADDVKTARPGTKRWHFVDLMHPGIYEPNTDCQAEITGDCAIEEIRRASEGLVCASTTEGRSEALRFLVHVVGDIHQPMHTLAAGGGGNGIPVVASFVGLEGFDPTTDTNLHVVWDSVLIRRTTWNWGAYVDGLETGWLAEHKGEPVDEDPVQWAIEANKEAVDALVASGTVLDDAYYAASAPVVDQQLGRAGVRLAAVLNRWLGDGVTCP